MARGWESKAVEAQRADRERGSEALAGPVSADEAARVARVRTIELTRARALSDLANARSHAHRQMLEAAIKALDENLAAMIGTTGAPNATETRGLPGESPQ